MTTTAMATGRAVALACGIAAALGAGAAADDWPPDQVAVVKQVEGTAMVSQEADYVDASQGMKLLDLDRILVLEDSTATLQMADGCLHRIVGARMLTLQAGDTCDSLAADTGPGDLERTAQSQAAESSPTAAAPRRRAAAVPFFAGAENASFLGMSPDTAIFSGVAAAGMGVALSQGTGHSRAQRRDLSPQ